MNQNYQSLIPKYGPFRFSPAITLPFGTVEVKAAWRPLSSIPQDQQNRYHTATVITYSGSDEQPTPELQTYALIALHLIHKTPNYPAFVFATFEQVDDLTNQLTGNPTGLYYVPTYASIAYGSPTSTTFPPSGQTVLNPSINFSGTSPVAYPNGTAVPLPVGNVASISGGSPLPNNNVAIPVTQPVATTPEVAAVNSQALALMQQLPGFGPNFTWQYYKLTGVQALPTNDETSEDFYLANIVVESSPPGIQLFRGFPPISNGVLTNVRNQVNVIDYGATPVAITSGGGCQGCHGVSQTQNGFDFSFLFFGADGGGFSPDTLGLPPPAVAAVRLIRRKYFQ